MTEASYSVGAVHHELAQMAWEEVNRNLSDKAPDTITLLQLHIRAMSDILSDPEQYRRLWERVKASR